MENRSLINYIKINKLYSLYFIPFFVNTMNCSNISSCMFHLAILPLHSDITLPKFKFKLTKSPFWVKGYIILYIISNTKRGNIPWTCNLWFKIMQRRYLWPVVQGCMTVDLYKVIQYQIIWSTILARQKKVVAKATTTPYLGSQ